jgi:PAS domain S-box-containing protein
MAGRRTGARDPAAAPPDAGRLAELVLGPQPAELQALIDSVPAFIWYKDADNRILRLNRLAAESMGKRVEDVEGLSTYELYPDEATKYHQDDLEVIHSGEPKLGIVERLRTASGETRWVRTDKIPYRNTAGAVVGLIVFAVDISERVHAEAALRHAHGTLQRSVDERTRQLAAAVHILNAETAERRRAEERVHAQQAELARVLRLHTLEGMAAQLAHEINQPLAAIVNFARGLGRRHALPRR